MRELTNILTRDLLHHLVQLPFQKRDRMIPATLAKGAHAIHGSATRENERCPTGQATRDIGSIPYAAIHHQFRARTEFSGQIFQRRDRRLTRIELPSSVIGYDDAIDSGRYGLLRILGLNNALDYQIAAPFVPQSLHSIRRQATGKGLVHKLAQVL